MTNVAIVDLGIERLVHIDQRIDAHEGEALRDRWEFGQALGTERGDKKKLPVGRLTEVCEATGKSRSEVQYRMQFAEEYDETRLSNALDNHLSWHEIIRSGLGRASVPTVPPVPTVLEGTFSTIVADPPWRYGNTSTRGAAEDHYPTMTIEQLCQLDIARDRAADESHLYLWATAGHLPDAFTVMEAWGFTYKTYLVWVKPQMGMGNYFRVSTELVLFGVKGGMRTQHRGLMVGQRNMSAIDRMADGYQPDFDIDAEVGKQGELWVARISDAIRDGSAEVKTDEKAAVYGNVFLEYECLYRGEWQRSPTGIAGTPADIWCHVIGETMIAAPTTAVRAVALHYKRRGRVKEQPRGSHPTRGVVIPLGEFVLSLIRGVPDEVALLARQQAIENEAV